MALLPDPTRSAAARALRRALPLLVVALLALIGVDSVPRAVARAGARSRMAMPMDWFATHPRVGVNSAQVAPADTFTVQDFSFDSDHLTTKIDTVHISVGQTVLWVWVNGTHTVTNGTGSLDPNAGTLFDQPMDNLDTTFSFTFGDVGTVPFFCRYHEGAGMKGVVVVSSAVPTTATTWGAVKGRYRR